MIRRIRISILVLVPILFWYVSDAFPSLVKAENLRLLSGIITVIWATILWFFQRLGSLTNVDSLPSSQLQTLELRFEYTRHRVWWMAGVSLVSSFLIWAISSGELVTDVRLMALFVGVLFSFCVSYLVIFPFWFNELQAFQDKLKINAAEKSKRESEMKQFVEDGKRQKPSN